MPFDSTNSPTDPSSAAAQAFSDLTNASQDAAQTDKATTAETVQKYADMADAFIWSNPKVQQWGDQYGLVFLDEGTAGLSTGQAAHNIAEPILRLIYSEGGDVAAYVDLVKAVIEIAKALKTLTSNDQIYEGISDKFPMFTYCCRNGQLDFQDLGSNCADARQKFEDIRGFLNNPFEFNGLMTFIYSSTFLNNWFFRDSNIWIPDFNGRTGKRLRKAGEMWGPTSLGPNVTAACSSKGIDPWAQFDRGKWKVPFPMRYKNNATLSNAEFYATVQNCVYTWQNLLTSDEKTDFILFGMAVEAKGWPSLTTLHDEQKAYDFYYKGLAQKASAPAPTPPAAGSFFEENKFLFLGLGIVLLLIFFVYFLTTKK